MKIALLGDVHLIADDDPYQALHDRRAFFKNAWPSFQRLLRAVDDQSPDLVILLGDLVDWFSPQNIAFGLDLLSGLKSPWQMVPGNHDLAAPSHGPDQTDYQTTATRDHLAYWSQQGVDLASRTLDLGGYSALLLDSALSDLPAAAWLADQPAPDLLFTHVPPDTPATRAYILSVDPRRSMAKYVISGAPDLYADHIQDRVAHVFTGHLHFPGDLCLDRTRFHLCTMSITMRDPNRSYSTTATATLVEALHGGLVFERIEVE